MIWTWPFWALYGLVELLWPPFLGRVTLLRSRAWCRVGVHIHGWGRCRRCGHDEFEDLR